MQGDYSLHLDLYNFEEPGSEKSRYILTSPRSLEACARFGIQPVELLPKPLSEFQDDGFGDYQSYANEDHAMEQFQKYERQRLRKLRLCREERERIIYEQGQNDSEKYSMESSKPLGTSASFDSGQQSYSDSAEADNYSSYNNIQEVTASYSPSNTNWSSGYVSGLVKNLMQRTYDESPAQHSRAYRYRPSSPSDSVKSNPVKGRDARRKSRDSKAIRRLQSGDEGTRSENDLPVRRQSVSRDQSRNSSLSSLTAMLPAHLAKSLDRLSDTDEKLLRVMLNKAEEEKLEKEKRLYSELGRMEEKRLMDELREIKERQHRMLLADKIRERDYQKELMKRKLQLKEEQDRQYREAMIRSKEDNWHRVFRRQAEAKTTKAVIRRLEDQEKKELQEYNLARAEIEREARVGLIHSIYSDRHKEAERNREERLLQERMKKQYYNNQEKQRYEMRKESIDRQLREEEAYLKSMIEGKHLQAEGNAQLQTRQKEVEITRSRERHQAKKELQEYQLKKMEDDVSNWKEDLHKMQEMNQERARRHARRVIEDKRERAQEQRRIKEQDHAANLARVERDFKHKQQEIKEIINLKDKKSKSIVGSKEISVRESREAARASRALRDAIREQTIKSSFDKMAEEAQRLARVEQMRRNCISGNKSSLTFG